MRGWPLDKSTLFTECTRMMGAAEVEAKPSSGCYVIGLFLEGAAWSRQHSCLVRAEPKQLVVEMPIIQVTTTYMP